ncbi:SPRT-like metalloprotease [Phaffia rhodozyma]|uniref:SPRT-like metalloprotease n=1 Tax=Phaffia rhodozyma TaxID=264483 RepID=A0A0F7SY78_PHARH|nr:SPRT-like metalloprotease [Phaffia rhodozyma]
MAKRCARVGVRSHPGTSFLRVSLRTRLAPDFSSSSTVSPSLRLINADVYRRQVDSLSSPCSSTITTSTTKPRGRGRFSPDSNNINLLRSPLTASLNHTGVNVSDISPRSSTSVSSNGHIARKGYSGGKFKMDMLSDSEDYREASSPSTKLNSGSKNSSVASSSVTPNAQPLQSSRKRTTRRRSGRCNAGNLSPPPSVSSKDEQATADNDFISDPSSSYSSPKRLPQGSSERTTQSDGISRKDSCVLLEKITSPAISHEVISLLSEDEEEDADESESEFERDAVERFVMGWADKDVPESSALPSPNITKDREETPTKPGKRLFGKPKGYDRLGTPSRSPSEPSFTENPGALLSSSRSIDSPAIVIDDWGFQGTEDGFLVSNEDDSVLRWSPPPKRPSPIRGSQPVHDLPRLSQPSPSSATPCEPRPRAKPRSKVAESRSEPSAVDPTQTVMKVNSKHWKARRETLALGLVDELDRKVFKQAIRPSLCRNSEANERKDTSELEGLVWTGKLRTTAGLSRWCRKEGPDGKDDRHICTVELSTKILDTEEKVLSTTAHELCHLATWIFDGKNTKPHGKEFKAWARKVMDYRTDISITTKHTFEIVHKYKWICEGCSASYGRDTKSIDPSKQCCGKCKGRLVPQFKSQNTNQDQEQGLNGSNATASGSGSMTPRKPNAYREFVKENYKTTASPGMSAPQVMKLVAEKWRAQQSAIPPSPLAQAEPNSSADINGGARGKTRVERGEGHLSSVLRELSI